MRLHLQALAVAPIFLFVLNACSYPLRANVASSELERRQYDDAPARDVISRAYGQHVDMSLEARSPQVGAYRPKEKAKLTRVQQTARKDAKRTATQAATQANKQKHTTYKSLTPEQRRAQRLDKPKRPKENMVKGAKQSDKAKAKQKIANDDRKARKAVSGAKFTNAKTAYAAMTNKPARDAKFTANGETVKGKHVRTAMFNTNYFAPNQAHVAGLSNSQKKKNTVPAPGDFQNRPQGPAGARTPPFPGMVGTGKEYPVTKQKGGFQGGSDQKGGMRVITQNGRFQGVVAHDATRTDPTAQGYMDHFPVAAT